ncbi:sigma-70 family RNA polymerase sigma factor [Erwinia mallotivora]|uniref:sigma-70 family RNA polymerase sigma factor n=1 Tax=Erwinia mallotivora TaxID=69222 RepID=UPI0035EAA338
MDKCDAVTRERWPELMVRAQAGDGQAYNRLLTALVPVIRTLAAKKIADQTLVEDVIQDVLLSIHRVRHTWDPDYPFLPWLMAIVSARATDALRRRGRRQHWEVEEASVPEGEQPATPVRGDASAELAGFLLQLPARQREMVEQVHLREMSQAEAAAHSNLSVSAVKSLLHRALKNLRRFGAGDERS